MKDSIKQVIVRKYGLRAPTQWDERHADILYRQNALWNKLVELDHADREEYRKLINTDPSIAPLQAALEQFQEEKETLVKEQKTARKTTKTRKSGFPWKEKIQTVTAEMSEIKKELKILRKAASVKNKAILEIRSEILWEKISEACRTSGLWWGNSEGIRERYKVARVRAMKEGVGLRFKRFTGEGQFRVRFNKNTMSEGKIHSPKCNPLYITPVSPDAFTHTIPGERRKLQKTTVRLAVDRDRVEKQWQWLEFPLFLHRPLPEDADLKLGIVTRKKIANKFHWHLVLTYTREIEAAPYSEAAGNCGINFGFRKESAGLRVATLMDDKGCKQTFFLPYDLLDKFFYVDTLKSEIDTNFNDFFTTFKKENFNPDDAAESLKPYLEKLKLGHIRHAGGLARLYYAWRETKTYEAPLFEKLEQWYKVHKPKYLEQTHLNVKTINRRNTLYRTWAKQIVDQYGAINIDATDYRKLARVYEDGQKVSDLEKIARRQRQIAAVSELRQSIVATAKRDGAAINKVMNKFTETCSVCDGKLTIGTDIFVNCENCHAQHHIDENAGANICKAA